MSRARFAPLLAVFLCAAPAAPARADDPRTAAFVPVELTFTAAKEHADPFDAVTLDVVFSPPGGGELVVPAFWAGGRVWKARYSSGVVGEHRWAARANVADAGLSGSGRVVVAAYTGDNVLFRRGPVRVAADRRHFAHADGTPFFWLGDTWWMGLTRRLDCPAGFHKLAADRRAKGFTVVQIVAGLYPDMPPFDPRGDNEAGQPWEPGFARIRPEYFDAADRRLWHLVEQGMTPCVVGAWGYFLPLMGEENMKRHWRYLVARYGAWPVVWCAAGEANLPYYLAKGFPSDDQKQAAGWSAVLKHVRATDPFRRPLTVHPTAINSYSARHVARPNDLIDFDLLQTPHAEWTGAGAAADAVRTSLAATPRMPVVNGEASYEMLHDRLPARAARAMFWACVTSGAAGHTYGANGVWQVNRRGAPHGPSPHDSGGNGYGTIAWDDAMRLPGSSQVAAGKRWLEKLPWHRFEPHPEWAAWADADPAPGDWVWLEPGSAKHAPVGTRHFVRRFDLPAGAVESARLVVTADDAFKLWVNGAEVGSGDDWREPGRFDVAAKLRPGPNVVVVRAENRPGPANANPAGLNLALDVELAENRRVRVVTGPGWKASATAPDNWTQPAFDPAGWPDAAVLARPGGGPWGAVGASATPPPTAFGIPDGPRVVYAVTARPVRVRGLAPGRAYKLAHFDPVAGKESDAGTATADAAGVLTVRPPFAEDWALLVTPDGGPSGVGP